MVIAEQKRLLTADEFFDRYSGKEGHYELVKGEVVEMAPTSDLHGDVAARIIIQVGNFVLSQHLGGVRVETGFILSRAPDVVRAPDVAVILRERLAPGGPTPGFFVGHPDLAVEVVSPNDKASEVETKVYEYLQAGTRRVWVVYPESRRVVMHSPDGTARTLTQADTLADAELLPGFALPVREIFEE